MGSQEILKMVKALMRKAACYDLLARTASSKGLLAEATNHEIEVRKTEDSILHLLTQDLRLALLKELAFEREPQNPVTRQIVKDRLEGD